MEEESVGGKGAIVVSGRGPEKGSVITRVRKAAEKSAEGLMLTMLEEVGLNIKDKHVPTMKMLRDFVELLKAEEAVSQERYESFAAMLWKECQLLEEEEREMH